MARIAAAETAAGHTVTVRGRLVAADLQRLERACGPALEHRDLHLVIVFREATIGDAASRAYVDRLLARGAVLRS